jgi:hypothetical protein
MSLCFPYVLRAYITTNLFSPHFIQIKDKSKDAAAEAKKKLTLTISQYIQCTQIKDKSKNAAAEAKKKKAEERRKAEEARMEAGTCCGAAYFMFSFCRIQRVIARLVQRVRSS